MSFSKVKAHCGIAGNEAADTLAGAAATHDKLLQDSNGWSAFRKAFKDEHHGNIEGRVNHLDDTDELAPGGWSVQHYNRINRTATRIRDATEYEQMCRKEAFRDTIEGDTSSHRFVRNFLSNVLQAEVDADETISWPNVLDGVKLWDAHSDPELTTLFQHLYDRVYTSNSYGHPLKQPGITSKCPLCNTGNDTAAHMRGECTHRRMQSEYIHRHDDVVSIITSAMKRSSHGFKHINYDQGSRCSLKPGRRQTLPPEMYSGNPSFVPDIVVIDNKNARMVGQLPKNEPLQRDLPYTVQILDVCVAASEERISESIQRKQEKYSPLIQTLKRQGHAATFSPVAIGSRVPLSGHTPACITCDKPLALRSRIWHSVIRSLRRVHLAYRLAQNMPSKPSQNPAIPRKIRTPKRAPKP